METPKCDAALRRLAQDQAPKPSQWEVLLAELAIESHQLQAALLKAGLCLIPKP